MDIAPLTLLNFGQLTQAVTTPFLNLTLATVNAHVVKLNLMTRTFIGIIIPIQMKRLL